MAKFIAPPVRIDVEVQGMKLSADISDLCRVDPDALLEEVTEHPAIYAYVAVLTAGARKERDAIHRRVKREKSQLYLEIRERKAEQRLTETMIDSEIAGTASIIEWEQALADAEETVDQLQAVCEAFRQRKDLIVLTATILRASGEELNQHPARATSKLPPRASRKE